MKHVLRSLLVLVGGFLVLGSAQAQVRITEVDSTASGKSSYGFDWFELTNFGSTAVDITGWKMDDDSGNGGSASAAVALSGITSIAAGQSVVFAEGGTASAFISNWFSAAHPQPTSFAFGIYTGSGVGLSSSGDAVNIFNATGGLVTRVGIGSSGDFASFDNSAGANNVTLTTASIVGVNSAYAGLDTRVGSPGTYAAPVPLPAGIWLLGSGLGLLGGAIRRRRAAA
ncbi:MAG: lamin tail domain-containing protein [Pseudomonadota bacterium]